MKKKSLHRVPLALSPDWSARKHTCINGRFSSFTLDADGSNASCLIKTDAQSAFYIDTFGNVGINTTHPSAQLEVVSNNGACLSLNHGGDKECNFSVDANGNLTIHPDGLGVTFTKSVNVVSGLYLRGELVTASAEKINFTDTTPGTAQPLKALVTDANNSIDSLQSLRLITLLQPESGGTGHVTLKVGDILVADSASSWKRLGVSANDGYVLAVDHSVEGNIRWKPSSCARHVDMATPQWTETKTYTIDYLRVEIVTMQTPTVVCGSTEAVNEPNCVVRSDNLPGTVAVDESKQKVVGYGSAFIHDFVVGDVITLEDSSSGAKCARRVVSVVFDDMLTVDALFDSFPTDRLFLYYRGGQYGVSYLYAIEAGFTLYHRSPEIDLTDLPSKSVPLPFFVSHQPQELVTRMLSPQHFVYTPAYRIVTDADNANLRVYDLSLVVPVTCCMVQLLITYAHEDDALSDVVVADANNNLQAYLPMSARGMQQLLIYVPVVPTSRQVLACVRQELAHPTCTYSLDLVACHVRK